MLRGKQMFQLGSWPSETTRARSLLPSGTHWTATSVVVGSPAAVAGALNMDFAPTAMIPGAVGQGCVSVSGYGRHVLSSTLTLLLVKLATARSSCPSPSRSAAVTANGLSSVAVLTGASKVPLPRLNSTLTVSLL